MRLDDGAAALAGGNSGLAIIPGEKAADSKLLRLVAGLDPDLKMPPEGPALSPEDVGKLRAWIAQGAKFGDAKSNSAATKRSTHWSFQPIAAVAVPAIKHADAIRNPIDNFVLARLEKKASTLHRRRIATRCFAGSASTCSACRRRRNKLTSLSATPGRALYERLVDRLLANPHYGERWSRHWLDTARYADSDGYEKDTGRPWAWRYREWVIQAFNSDMPYDRFVIEQIAGDLLPDATQDQRLGTGFHRNTLTNLEGGVDQEQYRVEQVIDRVNTTSKVFLGLTVGCAQCHDHKYDPISQREYYQFFSFFNSDVEKDIEAPVPGERERFDVAIAKFELEQAKLHAGIKLRRSRTRGITADLGGKAQSRRFAQIARTSSRGAIGGSE